MIKKIYNAVLIFLLALCLFIISSCSPQMLVTVDQNITPHDDVMKAISTLGYEEKYYSEDAGDYILDDGLFEILLAPLKLSMVDQYSIIMFDKDLSVPFELVILKLPKTDSKTDSDLIDKIKNSFKTRLEQYKLSMQDYLPQFIPYVENAEMRVTDNFIYYCVAENSSKATTDIYNFLAGK